jgi:hypothetical protein
MAFHAIDSTDGGNNTGWSFQPLGFYALDSTNRGNNSGWIFINEQLTVYPEAFSIGAALTDPVVFIEELVIDLQIGATLYEPTTTILNKSIVIKVNTVDISNQVIFNSLSVSNNLYSEPNNAYFEIIKSYKKSYVPAANEEVEIIDPGGTIFTGLLIKISKSLDGFLRDTIWSSKTGQRNLLIRLLIRHTPIKLSIISLPIFFPDFQLMILQISPIQLQSGKLFRIISRSRTP